MGYLYLFIALFSGVTKGYCGKKTSGHTNNFRDAAFVNSIRMLLCTAIGFFLVLLNEGWQSFLPSWDLLAIAALSGISTAVFVISWLLCVRNSAYMLLDIFLTLGVLIPLLSGNLMFQEQIKGTQWFGIALLLVAVCLMYSYNSSIKAKLTPISILLLFVAGIANGVADFSQKLFVKQVQDGSAMVFNFYTYLFASVILLFCFLLSRKPSQAAQTVNIKRIFLYILTMAICLFASSYFKTLAAGYLSSVLLYPLTQGGSLILSAIMSAVFFKEKMTTKAIFGLIISFIGLLLINLL